MNTKNAQYNVAGGIDCEIEHPRFGWIPFTASPDDEESKGRELFVLLDEDSATLAYVPPIIDEEAEALEALTRAIKKAEEESAKLFFRLCKVLIDGGVINPNAPDMAQIKTAFQEWKTLRGV